MIKKILIYVLVFSTLFVLTSCNEEPDGVISELGKEYDVYLYPDTIWGMSLEEFYKMQETTEEDYSKIDAKKEGFDFSIESSDKYLGQQCMTIYHFKKFIGTKDKYYLTNITLHFPLVDNNLEKIQKSIEKSIKQQEISTNDTSNLDDKILNFSSTKSTKDLPSDLLEKADKNFIELAKETDYEKELDIKETDLENYKYSDTNNSLYTVIVEVVSENVAKFTLNGEGISGILAYANVK